MESFMERPWQNESWKTIRNPHRPWIRDFLVRNYRNMKKISASHTRGNSTCTWCWGKIQILSRVTRYSRSIHFDIKRARRIYPTMQSIDELYSTSSLFVPRCYIEFLLFRLLSPPYYSTRYTRLYTISLLHSTSGRTKRRSTFLCRMEEGKTFSSFFPYHQHTLSVCTDEKCLEIFWKEKLFFFA